VVRAYVKVESPKIIERDTTQILRMKCERAADPDKGVSKKRRRNQKGEKGCSPIDTLSSMFRLKIPKVTFVEEQKLSPESAQ